MERDRAPAEQWLLSRVDRSAVEAVTMLLRKIAEQLAIATADGVSIRRLAPDGRSLVPLTAHHPDPERAAALAVAMQQTLDSDDGLWRPVLEERKAMRWHIPVGAALEGASRLQAEFLVRFPVRAVLAAPLVHGDVVLGGVSLVRFGSDLPYTEADEALLTACARRIAAAVRFQTDIEALVDAGE